MVVKLSRRQFVLATLASQLPRSGPVRLQITGSSGREGADLGVAEMTHTASLLGRTIVLEDGSSRIDLDGGRLTSGAATFRVSASPANRDAALRNWHLHNTTPAARALEWHAALERYGAAQLNQRFEQRFGAPMDAAAWIGWMLVKIAVESALRSMHIADGSYDGHKGAPLTFDDDGQLVQPLCIVDARGGLLGVVE
jgi:hypothetical protein